ncbi:MAG: putative toxin-antitoxin system toxin component, PIN family [Rhodocyclaceae bacterium]|jgi:putative PIN family toxin of toxin-antitoxin system|nr:putative toxin-antitoxin system toxin component, PIN family [Rhodocyclaceae bacterium]
MIRVVLDTNVLLSGIAYPGSIPGRIVSAWSLGSIEVILSGFIIDELRRVLPRLAGRHGMTPAEMDDFVDILALQCELVEPREEDVALLGDACDIPVLGALLAALEAGNETLCLITGDKDLLALADRYPIVTPAQFWARHGGL